MYSIVCSVSSYLRYINTIRMPTLTSVDELRLMAGADRARAEEARVKFRAVQAPIRLSCFKIPY